MDAKLWCSALLADTVAQPSCTMKLWRPPAVCSLPTECRQPSHRTVRAWQVRINSCAAMTQQNSRRAAQVILELRVRTGRHDGARTVVNSPTSPTRSPVFTSQLTPRSTCWFLNVMLTSSSFTPLLTVLAPAAPSPPPAEPPPRPRFPLPLPRGLPCCGAAAAPLAPSEWLLCCWWLLVAASGCADAACMGMSPRRGVRRWRWANMAGEEGADAPYMDRGGRNRACAPL